LAKSGDEFGPVDDMLEAFKAGQVVADEVLIYGGESSLEIGKFNHNHRHRGPAQPLDGFQPVPPGDKSMVGGHDRRLEKAQPTDAVNEVSDLGFGDGSANVTETDLAHW
jgi:hypothetical protein